MQFGTLEEEGGRQMRNEIYKNFCISFISSVLLSLHMLGERICVCGAEGEL